MRSIMVKGQKYKMLERYYRPGDVRDGESFELLYASPALFEEIGPLFGIRFLDGVILDANVQEVVASIDEDWVEVDLSSGCHRRGRRVYKEGPEGAYDVY